jgi:hypothetical protein
MGAVLFLLGAAVCFVVFSCVSLLVYADSGTYIGVVTSNGPLKVYTTADMSSTPVGDLLRGMPLVAVKAVTQETKSVLEKLMMKGGSSLVWVQITGPMSGWVMFGSNQEVDQSITKLPDGGCPPGYVTEVDTLYSCGYGNYWMRQWPIGTGEIGALVGGSPQNDRIPVAIADLFVGERPQMLRTWNAFRGGAAEMETIKQRTKFQESTRLLANGDFGQADRAATGMDSYPGQCTFEFLADINLSFDSPPKNNRKLAANRPPPQPRPVARGNPNRNANANPANGDRHITLLSMLYGYSSDTYLSGNSIQHREWIGNQKWNVLMGRMSCAFADNLDANSKGCLSFSVGLNRPGEGKGYHPEVLNQGLKPYTLPGSGIIVKRSGIAVGSSLTTIVARSYMCVALVCHQNGAPYPSPASISGSRVYSKLQNSSVDAAVKYLGQLTRAEMLAQAGDELKCSNGREGDIFVSITKESNENSLFRELKSQSKGGFDAYTDQMERCWKNVNGAIASVLASGTSSPAASKSSTAIALKSVKFTKPTSDEELDDMYNRLRIVINPNKLKEVKFVSKGSDAEHDLQTKDVQEDLAVASKLVPLLNVGRFMFLAGATKGPSNLQVQQRENDCLYYFGYIDNVLVVREHGQTGEMPSGLAIII